MLGDVRRRRLIIEGSLKIDSVLTDRMTYVTVFQNPGREIGLQRAWSAGLEITCVVSRNMTFALAEDQAGGAKRKVREV